MIVSVIVPVYNVSGYLRKCIDSICNSVYRELEIILVDDGSTDESGKICDKYEDLDERIKVIHKSNGGLSSARNVGMKAASGSYICFVDSDDYISKDMIQILLDKAVNTDADVVQCGFDRVDESGRIKSLMKVDEWVISGDEISLAYYTQCKSIPVIVWNKLFKKGLIDTVQFVEGRNNEDNMFGVDILPKVKIWASVDKILYHYLIRKNSIMGAGFTEKKFDSIYALKYVTKKTELYAPEYLEYVYFNRALNAFYLYYDIWKSNLQDKKKYYKVVEEEFQNNFIYVTRKAKISNKDKVRLRLFDFNHMLALRLYSLIV
jgi:Glycosyltransferases involved in cell wall biogenesis